MFPTEPANRLELMLQEAFNNTKALIKLSPIEKLNRFARMAANGVKRLLRRSRVTASRYVLLDAVTSYVEPRCCLSSFDALVLISREHPNLTSCALMIPRHISIFNLLSFSTLTSRPVCSPSLPVRSFIRSSVNPKIASLRPPQQPLTSSFDSPLAGMSC